MKFELKPCPYCGGKASFYPYGYDSCTAFGWDDSYVTITFAVGCKKCNFNKGNGRIRIKLEPDGELNYISDDREEYANDWNRRTQNEI